MEVNFFINVDMHNKNCLVLVTIRKIWCHAVMIRLFNLEVQHLWSRCGGGGGYLIVTVDEVGRWWWERRVLTGVVRRRVADRGWCGRNRKNAFASLLRKVEFSLEIFLNIYDFDASGDRCLLCSHVFSRLTEQTTIWFNPHVEQCRGGGLNTSNRYLPTIRLRQKQKNADTDWFYKLFNGKWGHRRSTCTAHPWGIEILHHMVNEVIKWLRSE